MRPQFYLLGVVGLGLGGVLVQSSEITSPPPAPTANVSGCPKSICADYVNECGKWYGGCFLDPACTGGSAWPTFTKPPCPTTKPNYPTTTCPSICVDNVNECGQMYGGCFPDPACTGGTKWPTFTKPPCPTTAPGHPTTTCPSICVDNVNECGQMYGGCFPDPACTGGTKWPTFTKPPCKSTTTSASSTSTCGTICADYINECGQMYGGCFPDPACTGGTAWPTFTKPPCTKSKCSQSICYDGIDKCGQFYGGCTLAPECGGPKTPTFWRPPCPPTTVTTPTTTAAPKCTLSLCVDGIDACGQGWGGCFPAPECGGKEPSWTKPPCSKTVIVPTVTKYKTTCPPGKPVTKFVTRTLTY